MSSNLREYLSPSFRLSEFVRSQAAINLGLDNTPGPQAIENLRQLCIHVLQPVRNHFALPVRINSGFRSANLNRAIGGALSSQHMLGEAADIEIEGVSNAHLWEFISKLPAYDQVIAEYLEANDPNAGWVHVSYRKDRNRKEAISCISRGVFLKGLHFVNGR